MACIHRSANAWKCRMSFSTLNSRGFFSQSAARICGQSIIEEHEEHATMITVVSSLVVLMEAKWR